MEREGENSKSSFLISSLSSSSSIMMWCVYGAWNSVSFWYFGRRALFSLFSPLSVHLFFDPNPVISFSHHVDEDHSACHHQQEIQLSSSSFSSFLLLIPFSKTNFFQWSSLLLSPAGHDMMASHDDKSDDDSCEACYNQILAFRPQNNFQKSKEPEEEFVILFLPLHPLILLLSTLQSWEFSSLFSISCCCYCCSSWFLRLDTNVRLQ